MQYINKNCTKNSLQFLNNLKNKYINKYLNACVNKNNNFYKFISNSCINLCIYMCVCNIHTYIAFHRKVQVMRLVSWSLYKHTLDNLFLQLYILPYLYLWLKVCFRQ